MSGDSSGTAGNFGANAAAGGSVKEIALSGVYRLLDHKSTQKYVHVEKYCMKALGMTTVLASSSCS
jgi:hypothetical protein